MKMGIFLYKNVKITNSLEITSSIAIQDKLEVNLKDFNFNFFG